MKRSVAPWPAAARPGPARAGKKNWRTILGLLLLAFCVVCRFCTPMADFYAAKLYPAISAVLSRLSAVVPFSLEEIVVLGFVAVLLLIVGKAIRRKKGFRWWLGKSAATIMWLLVWFYMGWGNNYYRTGLYARNGIQQLRFEPESFRHFLDDYARALDSAAALADTSVDRQALEEEIRRFYNEQVSPYGYAKLRPWQTVKRPLLNPLYSAVRVQGFMGPFFCEAQTNNVLLAHELPFTAAHELGHLAGVTSEAEANWWGFACCRASADPAVRYSGYLSILPYLLSDARRLLPEEEYTAWESSLCTRAKDDYARSRAYWKAKEVPWIGTLQNGFYNLYLRSNGISAGVKDYYGVVGMIMTMLQPAP